MLDDDRQLFRVDARRRLLVIGGVSGLLMGTIGARLFYLQLLKGGQYHDLAEDNRISLRPISPPRGRILDRSGLVLVENRPDYLLTVIPELTGDLKETLQELQRHLHLTEEEVTDALKQARNQRRFLPLRVRAHLDWDEVSRVETRLYDLPGVSIQIQALRHYPYGNLCSHALGYIGELNENEKKDPENQRMRPGEMIGKSGVERSYEMTLRGVEGVRELEVNAMGREVRELRFTPPTPGRDLSLTIDVELQQVAVDAMVGQTGAVVALDPRNGEVLVMASLPSYDPNEFIRGISGKLWKRLMADDDRPMINKAVQGQYPPGSTFKIATALAALEGRIDPEQRFFCPGGYFRYNHYYHCWRNGGHGSVNLMQAIEQSCDVYFYHVGEILGVDFIDRVARKLGLGQLSGIPLEGEKAGSIPSREWKKAVLGHPWYPGETLVNAIGQGYVTTTPLQLAVMIAAVANGGRLHRPTLVRQDGRPLQEPPKVSPFQHEHLVLLRRGLEQVMHGARGTAHRAKLMFEVQAGGKTGTAQVMRHRRTAEGKIIKSSERRHQDHALFVGYAPLDAPEIAIAVVVEHGGHGGSTAAPISKKIMDYYFARQRGALEEWRHAVGQA
ncbi:MAG: penicillin-binding protein 2 [Magnetococcales bacterium]|nr:penicillin-binding protein 2 [Magnetococcales bacterium]